MSAEDFAASAAAASKLLEDERVRHAASMPQAGASHFYPPPPQPRQVQAQPSFQTSCSQNIPDPGSSLNRFTTDRVDRVNLAAFRAQIPNLTNLTDDFVLNTPMSLRLKMESNSMKRGTADKARNLEDRLMANHDNIAATVIIIPEGTDDRNSCLHSSRFLPPAVCSAGEMWLAARDAIGPSGHPPVCAFDMAAVGMAGYVTPRGYAEMHNPGSTSMSLKLFHIGNMCSKVAASKRISLTGGEEALEVGDSMKDVASFQDFKHSLRAARMAMQFIYPWNFSLAALENFMLNSNFLAKDVGPGSAAISILSAFCDHVFLLNAERWRARKEFLDIIELGSVWATWHISRGITSSSSADTKGGKPKSKQTSQQGPHNSNRNPFQRPRNGFQPSQQSGSQAGSSGQSRQPNQRQGAPAGGTPGNDDICGRFNRDSCPNMNRPQCTLANGAVLRHVCNYRTGPNTRCEQPHQRVHNH